MDLSLWLAFTAASTALLLIPGPTVLLVLAYAVGQGRRVAVPTAVGVALGDLVAMSASLAGLGALVLASSNLFVALKWAGAIYLVYLGVRMILGERETVLHVRANADALTPRAAMGNAAVVTALNPKSIVFFIAFVPQFIDPAAAFLPQAAILTTTFVALALINALAYALAADRLRATITQPSIIRWLMWAGGSALIAMGVATAAMRRSAA